MIESTANAVVQCLGEFTVPTVLCLLLSLFLSLHGSMTSAATTITTTIMIVVSLYILLTLTGCYWLV